MSSIRNTSSGIARYLAGELSINTKDTEVIRFGLEIILGAVIKGLVIISVAYLLGIIPHVIVVLATFSSLRVLAGGGHCNTFGHCLAFTLAIGVFISKLSIVTGSYFTPDSLLVLIILSAITGVYCIQKWAPADTPNKPITRPDKRKKFRNLSLFYVFIWSTVMITFIYTRGNGPWTSSLALASTGGFLMQVFTISPAGYRFIAEFDHIFSRIITLRR